MITWSSSSALVVVVAGRILAGGEKKLALEEAWRKLGHNTDITSHSNQISHFLPNTNLS